MSRDRFHDRDRFRDHEREPMPRDDARALWRKAFFSAIDLAKQLEALPADNMDDPGIQKFSMLIMGKLLSAQSTVHLVCAAGIKILSTGGPRHD